MTVPPNMHPNYYRPEVYIDHHS